MESRLVVLALISFVAIGGSFQASAQPSDYAEKVFDFSKAKAERGDAEAQFFLGVCYSVGEGISKNEAEAVKWYRKAADQDHAAAQFALATCFAIGAGVKQDDREEMKWVRKAAELNYAPAQFRLGSAFYAGSGVPKDEIEAVKWFRKGADQNYAPAQTVLGSTYFVGRGVPKDQVEAVSWFRKAADQDDSSGQHFLGICYATGQGIERDDAQKIKWWRAAAERGHVEAQYNLGACYNNGSGVPKDYIEAYKWFLLAGAKDAEHAKRALTVVEMKMTREQVGEGQRLAREFKPRTSLAAGTTTAPTRTESFGSGFFITEDGFLISNQHVIRTATQARLVTSAGLILAKVVKIDTVNDLALLKAEGRFAVMPIAASRAVRLGSTVATVGFPNIGLQGFAPKLAKGEIAALSGAQDDSRYFQISVPLQPGNSGGALVDERGNVVGVVAAKLDARAALSTGGALPENVNYAVKSSFLLGFLESVPELSAKLKEPDQKERKFEDVVKSAEQAAVLVLVY